MSSYQNPQVRDLVWVIGSAPLLDLAEVETLSLAYCKNALKNMTAFLRQLDRDPGPLENVLQTGTDRRLGAYFETLVKYWLDCSPRYEVLAHRLPVIGAGRTLGELDLVVLDHDVGETQHWEVAVKFYLGVVDPLTQTIPDHHWYGPGQKDRLDIKCEHLLNHQIPQSLSPEGKNTLQKLGIAVDSHRIFCKGRLFYPYSTTKPGESVRLSKHHSRGWWITVSQFSRWAAPTGCWRILPKTCWLSAVAMDPMEDRALYDTFGEIGEQVVAQNRALCVALMENGMEIERGFVVPDTWPLGCIF